MHEALIPLQTEIKTFEEAGNSPSLIFKHYRELTPEGGLGMKFLHLPDNRHKRILG